MNNYKNILKVLLIDVFRRREKRQIAIYIILAISYLAIAASGVAMLAFIAPAFKQGGKQSELITALLFGDFVLTIALGLVAAISFLYLSKDNEFFLNLPIRPQTVFLAKLSMVYFTEVIVSAGLLLPTLITAGIAMNLSWLFFAFLPVMIFTVPLFALVFIAVISMPIVYFITLFRNRGAITTIIVIALFATVMGLYFYFVMPSNANHSNLEQADVSAIFPTITGLSYAFYPFYMLVRFALFLPFATFGTAASVLIQFAIFLLSLIVAVAVSYLVSNAFYNRVNSRVLERPLANARQGSHTQTNPLRSFLKKEFKEVVRNPSVALQALGGVVLCPLIVILVAASMSNLFSSEPQLQALSGTMFWSVGIMMLLSVGVGANAGANFCISREGANFYYLKILPASYCVQLKAKQTMYVLCGVISTSAGTLALSIAAAVKGFFVWWMPVLLLGAAFSWILAIVSLSIYMDLKNPRLDYKSIKEIVRRGKNSITAIVWTIISMVFSSAALICALLYADRSLTILAMSLCVYIIVGMVCAYLFNKKLYNNADALFEQISV